MATLKDSLRHAAELSSTLKVTISEAEAALVNDELAPELPNTPSETAEKESETNKVPEGDQEIEQVTELTHRLMGQVLTAIGETLYDMPDAAYEDQLQGIVNLLLLEGSASKETILALSPASERFADDPEIATKLAKIFASNICAILCKANFVDDILADYIENNQLDPDPQEPEEPEPEEPEPEEPEEPDPGTGNGQPAFVTGAQARKQNLFLQESDPLPPWAQETQYGCDETLDFGADPHDPQYTKVVRFGRTEDGADFDPYLDGEASKKLGRSISKSGPDDNILVLYVSDIDETRIIRDSQGLLTDNAVPWINHGAGRITIAGEKGKPKPNVNAGGYTYVNSAGKLKELQGAISFGAAHSVSVRHLNLKNCGVAFRGLPKWQGGGIALTSFIMEGVRQTDYRLNGLHSGDYNIEEIQKRFGYTDLPQTEIRHCFFARMGQGNTKQNIYLSFRQGELTYENNTNSGSNGSQCLKTISRKATIRFNHFATVDLEGKSGYLSQVLLDTTSCSEQVVSENLFENEFRGGQAGSTTAYQAQARRAFHGSWLLYVDGETQPAGANSLEHRDPKTWQAIRELGPITPAHPAALNRTITRNVFKCKGGKGSRIVNRGLFPRSAAAQFSAFSRYYQISEDLERIAPDRTVPANYVERSTTLVYDNVFVGRETDNFFDGTGNSPARLPDGSNGPPPDYIPDRAIFAPAPDSDTAST